MRKLVFVLMIVSILIVVSGAAWAGEIEVEIIEDNVKEVEAGDIKGEDYEEKESGITYSINFFKGNGGPVLGVLSLNLDDLNDLLTNIEYNQLAFNPFTSNQIILKGGGGIIGVKGGSRVGGYALKGNLSSYNGKSGVDYREANFDIAYGGFLYEQGIWSKDNFDLSLGIMLGGGSAELELIYEEPADNLADAAQKPGINHFEKEFVAIEPRVNWHQQLSTLIGFDLSVGYLLTNDFGEDWSYGNHKVYDDLGDFHGPSCSLRFSFGF